MATQLTPFRQARIQHNILWAMEGGLIAKSCAVARLQERLGFSADRARRVVDGDED